MADVGNVGSTGVSQYHTTDLDPTQGKDVTGSGVLGASGATPDPTAPTYTVIIASLGAFMPQIGSEDMDVLLAEVVAKMKEIQEESSTTKLEIDQEKKRTALADKKSKLDEANEKIEESVAKEEGASVWDKIKLAFQALGALLAIVVGAILLAVPGFQAVGALLLTVGIIGAIMVTDAIVKETSEDGLGIAGSIAKAVKPDISDEELAKIDMGFTIALAVIGIAVSVAAFFVPGGQANAVATMAQSISTIATAAINITTAAGDIGAGVVRFQAADLRADSQELQAEGKEIEALMQILDDFIDQAMAQLMGSSDRFNQMLDGLVEAIQDKGNTLARAKFSG